MITLKDPCDFPGGPVVKNLPSNAEEAGSIPGRETRISHVAEQWSLSPANIEPMCLSWRGHVSQTTEPMCAGAYEPRLERGPCITRKIVCSN